MDLLLKDLTWHAQRSRFSGDIRIHDHKIKEIGSGLLAKKKEKEINFKNHFLYPGLINSHDHLHMNLYPRLGTPPYKNYVEWANDIYKPKEPPIKEIESIPSRDRLLWGGLKNLISGVTSVIHHDPWHRALGNKDFPVKVLKKYDWANSLAFDKKRVNGYSRSSGRPFIIHASEGVDELAHLEIGQLDGLGILNERTILIHAIGLRKEDIHLITKSNSSIVWCPSSNLFMFGKTADISKLKNCVNIGLGSDSTLTGLSTFSEEMRTAAKTEFVTPTEIFEMVTVTPQEMFKLPLAGIYEDAPADLLILPRLSQDYYENLLIQIPKEITAVFVNGELRFGELEVARELSLKLFAFELGGSTKAIAYDIPKLTKRILTKASAKLLERNPLWQMLGGH